MSSPSSSRDPVEKLAEEFAERYRRGERPAVTEYTARHPELAEQIRDLFPALIEMEQVGSVQSPLERPDIPVLPSGTALPRQLGEYRILRQVGRGGMAVVYEAVQESLGRHVALKVLPFQALGNPTYLERFRREAKAAARLHHTNIVPVFGVGQDHGVHYYAMQFIQGQSLDLVLEELKRLRAARATPNLACHAAGAALTVSVAEGLLTGQFPEQPPVRAVPGADLPTGRVTAPGGEPACLTSNLEDTGANSTTSHSELTQQSLTDYYRSVARVTVQVAEALEYAHRNGVLHRDIKPSNLLLDTQGTVWVTDFGLAKADDSGELTTPGDIVGTLRYMAPERFRGEADARSDVYSLGITLYELLTLRPAFEASDRARLMGRLTNENPPRPRQVDDHIPRDLETIVLKAIAKEPPDRYPTAEAMAEDLRRFLADRPVQARRSSVFERTWRWCRRNPSVAGLAVFILILLMVIAVGSSVAAVWLARERNIARDNWTTAENANAHLVQERQRVAQAERDARMRLWEAHFARARASRWSGRPGRRFDTLDALADAAKVLRSLQLPDERGHLRDLRNEAIAGMALVDIRIAKQWEGWPPGTTALAFDARFERYARSDPQGNLSVRSLADDHEIVRLPSPGSHAYRLRFSPDGRFLAAVHHVGADIRVWDLSRGEAIVAVRPTEGAFDFGPDSRFVAIARPEGSKGSIRIHDLPSGSEVQRLALSSRVSDLAVDPCGHKVATVGPLEVQIRDIHSSDTTLTLRPPSQPHFLSWSHDGKLLATSSGSDHRVHVWATDTGKQQAVCADQNADLRQVTFNHAGDLLATTGWDETLRLWDPFTGKLLLSKTGTGTGMTPQFSLDDRLLGYTADGKVVELWEVASGRERRALHGAVAPQGIDFSPDGRLVAVAERDGVRIWDGATGEAIAFLRCFEGFANQRRSVLFHPMDGRLITSGSRGLHSWPVKADPEAANEDAANPDAAGTVLRVGPPRSLGLPTGLFSARISLDGRTIAVADRGRGQAIVLDLEGDAKTWVSVKHGNVEWLSVSPDGKWVATSSRDFDRPSPTKVWDAQSGRLAQELPVNAAELAFSTDGQWLVTGSSEECRFWKVGSWQPARAIKRDHAGSLVGPMAFSRDGRMLAIAVSPRVIQLTDLATDEVFATLSTPDTQMIESLCLSPDGSQLAATSGGAIQTWDLRLIRAGLAAMALDWDLLPYPPLDTKHKPAPLRVTVDLGELSAPPKAVAKAPAQPDKDKLRQEVEKHSQAIAKNPNDAEAYYQRAHLAVRLQEYSKARDDFNRAIALKSDHFEAYHHRGHVHERLGQTQEAIDDFSSALKGQPENAHLYHMRGRNYQSLKEYAKAVEDLNRALQFKLPNNAENADACNSLAWIHVAGPEEFRAPDKALPLAQKAVELAPERWAYCHTLGVVHYRLGRHKEAVAALQRGIKNNKDQATAFDLYFLAMCHHRLGDTVKARGCFDQAVAWQNQAKLTAPQVEELNAFRAEAETLLNETKP